MAKSKTVDGFLVESFAGAREGKKVDQEVLKERLDELDDLLLEQKLDINDVDYNEVIEKVMPEPMFRAFRDCRPGMSRQDQVALVKQAEKPIQESGFEMLWDRLITRHMRDFAGDTEMSLQEASRVLSKLGMLQEGSDNVVPITASQVDRFRSRCVTRTVSDFSCPPAATAFSNIFTRVSMPCSDYVDNKVCEFPLDPPPDFCCNDSNDDDPAEFYGLGPERCWKMPHPCYMSFAFGMHRNLVCVNANDFVRQQIEARLKWFDIIDEWKRTRLLFNAYGANECDRHTYNYDGTGYDSGWFEAADGGPWTNVLTDPALAWSSCSEGPMCAIEQVFEDQRDPTNSFPVEWKGHVGTPVELSVSDADSL